MISSNSISGFNLPEELTAHRLGSHWALENIMSFSITFSTGKLRLVEKITLCGHTFHADLNKKC